MMYSRRAFLRLGAAAIVDGVASPAAAAEPIWDAGDVEEFAVLGDEIITVGRYLRALDLRTGQERRSARLRRSSNAEGPDAVAATASAIVFGWYVWYEDVYIACVDPRSVQTRWTRRIKIVDRERENVPYVTPVVRPDGIFVLISGKYSENLFRLRPDTGETVWSRYIPHMALRDGLGWHGGRLLVRSRVTRGADASGDLLAVDPATGSTVWRVRLQGQQELGAEAMLVADNRAYIVSPVPPGNGCKLHIVDLNSGTILKSHTIDSLADPFAFHDGIVYLGGGRPAAWDVSSEQIVWRADLEHRHPNIVTFITHQPVFDAVRRRLYLGETKTSFFILSSTDGSVLRSVDVRRGSTNPSIMATYGAYRMHLERDVLLVGAGVSRLLAFSTASL